MKCNLSFKSIVLIVSTICVSSQLSLYTLPKEFANLYGAACLDGSPPAFYYAPAADPAYASNFQIMYEGGGWCFDETAAGTIASCASRAMGGGGSSNNNAPTMIVGGQLSQDSARNPYYYNWTMIFMRYCDGASGTSNATDPVPIDEDLQSLLNKQVELYPSKFFSNVKAPSEIYFRGRANVIAQLEYLKQYLGLGNATDIIVTGGSAGATTAYLALDFIKNWAEPNVRVVGAPDAGFFQDTPKLPNGDYWYRDNFAGAYTVWNSSGALSQQCLDAYPQNQSLCLIQPYAAKFIETPFMILNSAYDAYQTINERGLNCVPSVNGQPVAGLPSCNSSQLVDFQAYRLSQLASMQDALDLPGTGAFVTSCFVHEQNVDYCSSQALPNCRGFIEYTVEVSNGSRINMAEGFHQWHTAIQNQYDDIVKIRRDIIQNGNKDMYSTSYWKQYQVLDSSIYPANPSCPFPI
jgi:O-palmitoleoyl-L-serine hydrolase